MRLKMSLVPFGVEFSLLLSLELPADLSREVARLRFDSAAIRATLLASALGLPLPSVVFRLESVDDTAVSRRATLKAIPAFSSCDRVSPRDRPGDVVEFNVPLAISENSRRLVLASDAPRSAKDDSLSL